jgi:hypothetical protein
VRSITIAGNIAFEHWPRAFAGPKTLTEARERIEVLEAQLRGSGTAPKPASAPASPKAKAHKGKSAICRRPDLSGNHNARRGSAEQNRNAKRAEGAEQSSSARREHAGFDPKILDVTTLDDLRLLLNNPAHTPTQQSVIYAEIRKRRALVENRFQ